MRLLETIHRLWAETATLHDAIDESRVLTGAAPDAALPYCTIVDGEATAMMRCNTRLAVDDVALTFAVYDTDHDNAKAIADAIKLVFHRESFALDDDGGTVIKMTHTSTTKTRGEDRVWEFSVLFSVWVQMNNGV